MAYPVTKAAQQVVKELHGVVVSAGLMQKTVKVRVGGQKYNRKVQKMFTTPKSYLVHDPNSSLRTGDVVSIMPGTGGEEVPYVMVAGSFSDAGAVAEDDDGDDDVGAGTVATSSPG
ncbi:hypothetical protein BN1723_011456 [Verticillium longisporum]|uniref:30S ribosomal protein S17 n=1 Tax=Verticillium longisporum TaxID=100787 RepID=A0A0G4L7J9_VERLO|nr:hypothetical protein BN1723_011456 [Verticillium longisporum]